MIGFLDFVRQSYPNASPCVLVSGADEYVRQLVGQQLVNALDPRHKTLYLLDNTQNGAVPPQLGAYPLRNAAAGEISLCADLFETASLTSISRLRALLSALGFDAMQTMRVVTYLDFVRETERRLGNAAPLTLETLEEYSGMALVQWKLRQLALSEENRAYLLARYSEVSGAAADFDMMCALLRPFTQGPRPAPGTGVYLPVGRFAADPAMQHTMTQLLLSSLAETAPQAALVILDDGMGDRPFLTRLLQGLPPGTEVHLLSQDVFSLPEQTVSTLMNTFPVRVFSRHESMASCRRIEALCGEIDVVRPSSSVTTDRRWRANSAWDMLLGNNKTETSIRSAPVKESRFRKELAARLAALLMERKGLTPGQAPALSWAAYRETQYDRLADTMRAALDLPAIYRMMEGSGRN